MGVRVKYCQLFSEVNKEKRVTWCLEQVTANDLMMDDAIFTNESTIEIKAHNRVIFVRQDIPQVSSQTKTSSDHGQEYQPEFPPPL